jgi:hypothetical protein
MKWKLLELVPLITTYHQRPTKSFPQKQNNLLLDKNRNPELLLQEMNFIIVFPKQLLTNSIHNYRQW